MNDGNCGHNIVFLCGEYGFKRFAHNGVARIINDDNIAQGLRNDKAQIFTRPLLVMGHGINDLSQVKSVEPNRQFQVVQ